MEPCDPHERTPPLTDRTKSNATETGIAQFEHENVRIAAVWGPREAEGRRTGGNTFAEFLELWMPCIHSGDVFGILMVAIPCFISRTPFRKKFRSGDRSFGFIYPEKVGILLSGSGVNAIFPIR